MKAVIAVGVIIMAALISVTLLIQDQIARVTEHNNSQPVTWDEQVETARPPDRVWPVENVGSFELIDDQGPKTLLSIERPAMTITIHGDTEDGRPLVVIHPNGEVVLNGNADLNVAAYALLASRSSGHACVLQDGGQSMKTITREQLAHVNKPPSTRKLHKVIDGDMVYLWCGSGWVAEAPPTKSQRSHLVHVVDTTPKEVRHGSGQRKKEEAANEEGSATEVIGTHDRRAVPHGEPHREDLHLSATQRGEGASGSGARG